MPRASSSMSVASQLSPRPEHPSFWIKGIPHEPKSGSWRQFRQSLPLCRQSHRLGRREVRGSDFEVCESVVEKFRNTTRKANAVFRSVQEFVTSPQRLGCCFLAATAADTLRLTQGGAWHRTFFPVLKKAIRWIRTLGLGPPA